MRELIAAKAYADVNNALASFTEEHEVAGLKSGSRDTHTDTELGFSGAGQLDSRNGAVDFPGEPGTVDTASVGPAIFVGRAQPRLDRSPPCGGVYWTGGWISGRRKTSADRGWAADGLDGSATGDERTKQEPDRQLGFPED